MIIPHHDESRKRKKKNLTKKLSILNAYINFRPTKVSNSRTSTIDFGVVQILNDEAPKALVPLKNGKVILAVGSKSTGMTYDTVPVTVELQ